MSRSCSTKSAVTSCPDAVIVLQGPFLLHPRLAEVLDRVVYLEVSDNQALRRVAGRDAAQNGPESLLRVRRHMLPIQRAFDELVDPREHAHLCVDAENALGPPPPPSLVR